MYRFFFDFFFVEKTPVRKKFKMQLVETLKVNANYLTVYNTIIDGQSETCNTSEINFTDTFHDCKMSPAAVKTIKKAVNVILYLARRRHYKEQYKKYSCLGFKRNDLTEKAKEESKHLHLCTFLTLTLPATQIHTDKELTYYCLHPFLAYLKKYKKIRYFVWKKELQKNGNLHYHLVTDKYIDALLLRRVWNRIINRGKVDGVKNPFDYVDRYHYNQLDFYKNGWDNDKMFQYFSANQNVIDKTDNDVKEIQEKENRFLTYQEYEKIHNANTQKAFERAKNIYYNEIKKPVEKQFINPNSTDIKAVNTPQTVSAYLAKYISKDCTDNPALTQYQNEVYNIKSQIFATLKDIADKKANNEDVTALNEQLQKQKEYLKQLREKCPIQGRLWFKSSTLTPFLSGASDFIYSDLSEELKQLVEYLEKKQKEKNKKYILYNYELNADGTENTDKILNITFLVNIFELQTLRYTNSNKLLFPLVVQMWRRFIYSCIHENNKRGLYEDYEKEFYEIETDLKNIK